MVVQTVLILENDPALRGCLSLALQKHFNPIEITSERAAAQFFLNNTPTLMIVGSCDMGCGACLRSIEQVRQLNQKVPVILLAKNGSEDLAVAAFRAGAADYMRCPFTDMQLNEVLQRNGWIARARPRATSVPPGLDPHFEDHKMIGSGPVALQIRDSIRKVAVSNANVLITGETGTGKELVAELIHRHSARWHGPFVCVNCAAIPDTLLESELFGYERGAFTGALRRQEGKLRLANGGTIFFDEIGDMSLQGQAKILRAIETRQVLRLGGTAGVTLDIRILAATNRNEASLSNDGGFRKDLYFRLNVAHIHLPPLRDRKVDIPELLDFYREHFNKLLKCDVHGFSHEVLQLFVHYPWPGNVRELKNTVEALFLNSPATLVGVEDLSDQVRSRLSVRDSVTYTESDRVLSALLSTNWNKSRAAEKLHWSRMTLYRKLAKYHLGNKAS